MTSGCRRHAVGVGRDLADRHGAPAPRAPRAAWTRRPAPPRGRPTRTPGTPGAGAVPHRRHTSTALLRLPGHGASARARTPTSWPQVPAGQQADPALAVEDAHDPAVVGRRRAGPAPAVRRADRRAGPPAPVDDLQRRPSRPARPPGTGQHGAPPELLERRARG